MLWSILIVGINVNLILPTEWCEILAYEWRTGQLTGEKLASGCVPIEHLASGDGEGAK